MIGFATVCNCHDQPALKASLDPCGSWYTIRVKSVVTGRTHRMQMVSPWVLNGGTYIVMPEGTPMGELHAFEAIPFDVKDVESWFRSDDETPLCEWPSEDHQEEVEVFRAVEAVEPPTCAQAHGPAPESACAGARVDVEPEDAQESPTEPEESEEDVQDHQEPDVAPEAPEKPSGVNKLPTRQEVIDLLRFRSPLSAKDMAITFGLQYDIVRHRMGTLLSDMEDKGMIRRAGKGATGGRPTTMWEVAE